jgi:hypothetical protein
MESDGIQEHLSNRQTAKYVLTGGYSAEVVNDISTYKCIFYMARFSPAISDGQGFAKPQGYAGKGTAGKGQGRDN